MTDREAIWRIRDHMIAHHIEEPRAVLITEALEMAIEALENREAEKERIIRELEENFENTVEPNHFENDREEMWYEVGINEGIEKAIKIVRGGKE